MDDLDFSLLDSGTELEETAPATPQEPAREVSGSRTATDAPHAGTQQHDVEDLLIDFDMLDNPSTTLSAPQTKRGLPLSPGDDDDRMSLDSLPASHGSQAPSQDALTEQSEDDEPDLSFLREEASIAEHDLLGSDFEEQEDNDFEPDADQDQEDPHSAAGLEGKTREHFVQPLDLNRFEDIEQARLDLAEERLQYQISLTLGAAEEPEDFIQPEHGEQVNRKQPVVPDLQTTPAGDIPVGSASGSCTLASAVEPDVAIRLSSTYAKSLTRTQVLVFLAPSTFLSNRPASLRTRWETTHTLFNSLQTACLDAYGLFVIRWLEFAEANGIPAEERFPAREQDVAHWLGSLAHQYSSGYVKKHLNGLAYWHRLHLIRFDFDAALQRQLLVGAATLTGAPKDPRDAATVKDLDAMIKHWNLEADNDPRQKPRSTALTACALFAFFAMCRLKDVTVERRADAPPETSTLTKAGKPRKKRKRTVTLKAFDRKYDASGAAFTFFKRGTKSPSLVRLHPPFDKSFKTKGRDRYAPEQTALGPHLDPVAATKAHTRLNNPTEDEPAFTFVGEDGTSRCFLTRAFFMHKVNEALSSFGRTPLAGHSFRPGGLNFYKTAGVDLKVVQAHGGWASSSSFKRYHRFSESSAVKFAANRDADSDYGDDLETDDSDDPENGDGD
ncbi:hypothetical protein JCM10450v2_004215 [Rhodotorula kratochvilovae]